MFKSNQGNQGDPVGFVSTAQGMAMLAFLSDLSLKTGLEIANAQVWWIWIIGEVAVIVRNTGNEDLWIKDGDRIAQVVFVSIDQVRFVEGVVGETSRGEGGFGSTGVHT